MIYALNPKHYINCTNYIMQFFFKTQEKNLKQNFKAFKQEIFFTKKNLNLKKKSNKFCEKPKEKICF